ncbi:MAG TPA: galactokinase [Tepidisphaeraceae bacterium]|jgi:galactokinase|nr:galactokinase [Tepidisphaeraceae bacterium]
MQTVYAELREQFQQTFGAALAEVADVQVIRAPGRVNLIGEHTDYNDGFVFPMAIEPEVRLACRARTDGLVRLASTAFPGQIVEFSVQKKIERGEPKWANYSRGVAAELLAAGIPLVGMDALLANTLPVGGGLSSSAAVEVATGRALLALASRPMDGDRLALLCQRAEHAFAGVPVGIMDQMIVASAKAGSAMLLDCRSLEKKYVTIDANELRVVIINSMTKHELTGGEYAQRKAQCEEGVEFFRTQDRSIRALRDVTMAQVDAAENVLPDEVFRRCRHVVGENARTVDAASKLEQRRYEEAGLLMVESHESLRDDYEVSTPELDFLTEQATKIKGVYGARMTGGGFGGCIVALAQPRSVDGLIQHIKEVFGRKYAKNPDIYVTAATGGAGVVSE